MSVLLEIKRAEFPPDTPYGVFLASTEAEQVLERFPCSLYPRRSELVFPHSGGIHHHSQEKMAFSGIQEVVAKDMFPVLLRPGEGLWIAERSVLEDLYDEEWYEQADTFEEALLLFLGPDRLATELPAKRLAELRERYAKEGLFD